MDLSTILGKRIAEIRKRRGLTQTQLAERMGMSHSSVASWETGKRDPDSTMIARLAAFFDVSTDYLLGRPPGPLTLNQRITALRNMKHLTARQMAEELGVDLEQYRHWESGKVSPGHKELLAIADYHNIDLMLLYGLPPSHLPSEMYADGYTEQSALEDMEETLRRHLGHTDKEVLDKKEERDIAKQIERIMSSLESETPLAFDGEPLDDEDKELLRISLENSLRLAKQIAKKKFTPRNHGK